MTIDVWHLVVAVLVPTIIGWTAVYVRIARLEERFISMQRKLDEHDEVWSRIRSLEQELAALKSR